MKGISYFFLIFLLVFSCNPSAEQNSTSITQSTSEEKQKDKDAPDEDIHTEEELSEDKIQSLKVAYFTKELSLTSEEAERFWPIYNKHTQIYKELGDTEWDAIKKGLREVDTYSEEEANQLLERYKSYLNQRLINRLTFVEELETVISPKKIMLLKHAEYNFNKKLLKQYRSGEATTK